MTKTASIAILCVICAIALFFGVCSCLPGGLEYGEYDYYNSAINLFQGDSMFADSVVATYKVKLNKDTESTVSDIASAIESRLGNMYGRYFSKVTVLDGDKIEITVSKTANRVDNAGETSILSAVTSTGKVDLLTSETYSESGVVLTSSHVSSCKTERYAHGEQAYHIVTMKLNSEGSKLATESNLNTSSTYYLAVDGTVAYGVRYTTDGKLQVYTSSEAESQRLIGLTKSGALDASLTSLETKDITSIGGLVFAIVMAALIVGSWIFYLVRYKTVAIAAIVSQLVAVVIFIMFAGLVYFNLLNIASAIGIVLGYCLMSTFTCLTFERIRKYSAEKTFSASRYLAFREMNKWNCIVHAIMLVLGVALWLIPTGVTAPLGNALVYTAVLSFGVTMGLNRLFSAFNLGIEGATASARNR